MLKNRTHLFLRLHGKKALFIIILFGLTTFLLTPNAPEHPVDIKNGNKNTPDKSLEDIPQHEAIPQHEIVEIPPQPHQVLGTQGNPIKNPVINNNNNNNVKQPPPSPKKTFPKRDADPEKRNAIKNAIKFAWDGYVTYAWGKDELKPVTKTSHDWLGLGMTIVDSLDTLYLAGLDSEFKKARDWVETAVFNKNREVSVFETTIRMLGGLLSAYEFSGDKMFLLKAQNLADILSTAFDTPSGIPYTTINLYTGRLSNPSWTGSSSILSEMGTVQLEYAYLAHHTNNSVYKEKALKVFDILDEMEKPFKGLYPVQVSISKKFTNSLITMGALGDSFYEYLLKVSILLPKNSGSKYRRMYEESAQGLIDHMVKKTKPSDLTYLVELQNGRENQKMDHLACFAGGMFALGSNLGENEEHLKIGAGITETCHEMYKRQKSGISPEIVKFTEGQDFYTPQDAKHYLLRPETVESYFVLFRITGDQKYRDWGWEAFQAIEKHCKTDVGYSGIRDVTSESSTKDDMQQSFFLAETLKYLFLLFSDTDVVPLDKYVFNTECHPLGIIK